MSSPTTYTRDQVSSNNHTDSLWAIIDSKVYDLTDFADAHPGGAAVLRQVAGCDATADFYNLHRHDVLTRYDKTLLIGTVVGETPQVANRGPGELSLTPYAEPLWLSPAYRRSPYYTDSHRRLQRAMRRFTDEHVTAEAQASEESGEHISQSLIDRMADAGILHMRLGPGPHMRDPALAILGGGVLDGKDYDAFHDLVVCQELSRPCARGFQDSNMAGLTIGLTVVLNFGGLNNPALGDRVTRDVLSGRKKICLAVTEAFGGSDVSRGIRTTAVKTDDGRHYLVNGTKKWITNGTFADYFVVAVRTDKGLSVLLVERGEGVETTPIKTSYSAAAGTAFVTFEHVRVPVENLLGEENKGISIIFSNFNHERWASVCAMMGNCRVIVEESLKWANQRLVFGTRLIEQPVIRQRLAKMIALTEANQAWLETITHQMCHMPYQEQAKHLGGPIALLKMSASRASHEVIDEAVQVWGGRGLTRTGMGRAIEAFNRSYKMDAVLAGTEEILADLGVRQAMRNMPKERL